jgi:hypothetical protein
LIRRIKPLALAPKILIHRNQSNPPIAPPSFLTDPPENQDSTGDKSQLIIAQSVWSAGATTAHRCLASLNKVQHLSETEGCRLLPPDRSSKRNCNIFFGTTVPLPIGSTSMNGDPFDTYPVARQPYMHKLVYHCKSFFFLAMQLHILIYLS